MSTINKKKLILKVIFTAFAVFIFYGAVYFNDHPSEVAYFGPTMFLTGIAFMYVSLMAYATRFRVVSK